MSEESAGQAWRAHSLCAQSVSLGSWSSSVMKFSLVSHSTLFVIILLICYLCASITGVLKTSLSEVCSRTCAQSKIQTKVVKSHLNCIQEKTQENIWNLCTLNWHVVGCNTNNVLLLLLLLKIAAFHSFFCYPLYDICRFCKNQTQFVAAL